MSTMDKVKNALHLNKDHTTTGSTTTGPSTTGHTTHTGTAEGVAGPHNSRLANAADPRIDSDLDGRGAAGTTTHGTGLTGGTAGGAGYTSTTAGNTNAGPHNSNIANKLDPRVDSDMDGSRTVGGTTGAGTGYGGTHTGNTMGTTTGTTGGLSNSTNAGPHDSNLANKLDPRVDSDLDGRGNRHGATTGGGIMGASGSHATPGSGTAQNTAGPHNSDTMNKLDPRVDADMDGSTTIGGNRTRVDTPDDLAASKVPPSVFAENKSEPQVLHRHPSDNFVGRHGGVSEQEQLSGV